jgi:hypothetical protein
MSPVIWHGSCVGTESTLHQVAPYIGKMKSTMAKALILASSSPSDTIFDPFVGSGAVVLESLTSGRGVVCCDSNPYAVVLTKAKLFPPLNLKNASDLAEKYIRLSKDEFSGVDLNKVPEWVSSFFHPATLKEVIALVRVLRRYDQNFLLACLLGILHHQRPGFLSYPASHAIPYLRTKKFPREEYPQLYEYRALKPRLLRKIERVYKRFPQIDQSLKRECYLKDISNIELPENSIDAVVTSPPYMNTLDYVRDNRLRLWFLGYGDNVDLNKGEPMNLAKFESLMTRCFRVINHAVRPGGKCFFVTGEVHNGKLSVNTATVIRNIATQMGNFKCEQIIEDTVPQDRRIRKTGRRVKREFIVVLRKEK